MNGKRLQNIAGLFRSARSRTIIIFTAVVMGLAILAGVIRLLNKEGPASGSSRVGGVGGIQSVPGGFDRPETAEYARLQEEQNISEAATAAKQGTSAIPTIIRSQSFDQGAQTTPCCQPCGCPHQGAASLLHPTILTPGTLAYDSQGHVIGTIGPDGKVRDASGKVIGTVGPDGLVRDAEGNVIGNAGTVAAGTPVFDSQGKLIGTVGPDGKVRNANGTVLGTIGPDGVVRDVNGNVIGKAATFPAGAPGFDSKGKLIGTVGPHGQVRNAEGKVIGSISPDGLVRNEQGKVIGKVGEATGLADAVGQPVYDAKGHLIGRVGPDGKVFNAVGKEIGTVSPDGLVRDTSGKVIGKAGSLPSEGVPVYDAEGHLIGKALPDGKVVNAEGAPIGTVGPDGLVRDANGNVVGKTAQTPEGTPVFDKDGRLLGTVGPDGKVLDADGRQIGTIGPDDEVRDATGKLIGKAGKVVAGMPVYDPAGHVIGTVGRDGKVRDAEGNVVGTVGPNGTVRDASGKIIGKTGPTLTGQPVYSAQGRLIGVVGPDGKVRDANGRLIGSVGMDGQVRSPDGAVIGSTTPPGAVAGSGLIPAQAAGTPTGIPGASTLPSTGESEREKALKQQAQLISQQQADQLRQQLQGGMAAQASQLLSAWAPPSPAYVEGLPPKPAQTESQACPANTQCLPDAAGKKGNKGKDNPVVKAGTIMYAVLLTSVNTDNPGPVLAKIVEGKFKGGRLIGSIVNEGDKVMLQFNTITLPYVPSSVSINSVAIDQCTAHTALSDYTNHHYLLRYGSLFAASFLQGYAQALSQSGATVVSTGLATSTAYPNLSPAGKFMVALGNVGNRYSAIVENIFNTPPTVHVFSGTAVGILFLSDVPPLPGGVQPPHQFANNGLCF
jgi:intracellular multiplication protein IcmE